MSSISPISKDNIKVSYANNAGVLFENVSVSEANNYEKINPGTIFLFLDGDQKYQYLNINQVNSLTVSDLITKKSECDTSPKPAGPPTIIFSGGGGIGAEANPIVGPNGQLLGIDIVRPGIGYETSPIVTVIDDGNIGSGAVVQVTVENGSVNGGIVLDSGNNYIPPQPTPTPILQTPSYPVLLGLKDIIISNPGINYNPGVDVIEISPNNGTVLQAFFTPFGQVARVKVIRSGLGFTNRPNITIRSDSGVNADFTPVFEIIRDPNVLDSQIEQRKILTVIDTVGLQVQGFVGGKPYYGNIYYDNGEKYAGPYKSFDTQVRVYDILSESI
jgi:hypothetical protein